MLRMPSVRWSSLLLLALCVIAVPAFATDPNDVSVFASATVTKTPPAIKLAWAAKANTTAIRIDRKAMGDKAWTKLSTQPAITDTTYTDTKVTLGIAYEYQITISHAKGTATGYLYSGIEVPLVESRGTVILMVETEAGKQLANELAVLVDDIEGDGWKVLRHDVAATAKPTEVKALIAADYASDPTNVKALFLFGHIPVVKSGWMAPDGHAARAFCADTYYATMTGTWTDTTDNTNQKAGDGIFDQSTNPAECSLAVGRVDMANLGAFAPKTEIELLKNYLAKDHAWRQGKVTTVAKGMYDDNFGTYGEGFAQNAFRNFSAFFGPDNVVKGNWDEQNAQPYLWAYGCGGGSHGSCGGTTTTADLAKDHDPAVFTMLFGSYFCEWDHADDILRAAIATPTNALTCAWAARPNWFFHHMALGEPIATSTLLVQNNNGVLYTPAGVGARQVHATLLGDPTLRMHMVVPPSDLTAVRAGNGVKLAWSESTAPGLIGYHVFRCSGPGQPYVRLTSTPITAATYADAVAPATNAKYRVRAIVLTTSASGSYYNASLGIAAEVSSSGNAESSRADLMIKLATDGTYVGNNTYSSLGTNEKRTAALGVGDTAVYNVKVQNDGANADSITLTGPAGGGAWTVTYYDAARGGNDITAAVTGAGWTTAKLNAQAAADLRIEVKLTEMTTTPLELTLLGTSVADARKSDAVVAMASTKGTSATGLKLIADPGAPVVPGTIVTLTAVATGGTGLEYRFFANDGRGWVDLRAYDSGNTCTWKPKTAGTYSLLVWVRALGSKSAWEQNATIWQYVVKTGTPTLAVTAPSTAKVNTSVSVAAAYSSGNVEYAFYTSTDGKSWKLLRAYTVANNTTWKPSTAGTYLIKVCARTIGSAREYDAMKTVTVTVQ
jgi:hypothetical protein